MILLISVGVLGQAKVGAFHFSSPAFEVHIFFWLEPPQAASLQCGLPTAFLKQPKSISKSCLPKREVCLRLISTSFGIG